MTHLAQNTPFPPVQAGLVYDGSPEAFDAQAGKVWLWLVGQLAYQMSAGGAAAATPPIAAQRFAKGSSTIKRAAPSKKVAA